MVDELNQRQITIVDDDDFLVNMYATKFGNSGISVQVCRSGEALLETLRAGTKSELILLDIVMPGKDGLTVLKEIRQQKLAENIPVIMLTNQGDEDMINQFKTLNVSGYIVKAAATPTEVVEEVKKIIQKQ
jgi:CheY-like chemotaxis protein